MVFNCLGPLESMETNSRITVISSVQSLSCVQLFVTPWAAAHQASLYITNPWSLLKLMSISQQRATEEVIGHNLVFHSQKLEMQFYKGLYMGSVCDS